MKPRIYLDHNATTPVLPEVLEAMRPFWADSYGNPSSIHQMGSEALRELRRGRREVASFLGAQEESEIIFTSGGTESNNAAFRSAVWTQKGKKRLVTTSVEHSSVLKPARALEEEGAEIILLPVDPQGNLDLQKLNSALTDDTFLVSIMAANNETGVIFPVEEIGKLVHSRRILFHVDAVQAIGKIPLSLKASAIDFLSLSAHKFGGPKGIGALYVKKGVPFRPLIFGGSQEKGRRAGTENVSGAIGLGEACRQLQNKFIDVQSVGKLRDYFEEKVFGALSQVEINGDKNHRLPNTSNLSFHEVDAEALLILLDEAGIYASSGSACLSGAPEPSHVLKAMGFSDKRAKSSVRFSFGPKNTFEEVDELLPHLQRFVNRLREIELKEQHPHSVV